MNMNPVSINQNDTILNKEALNGRVNIVDIPHHVQFQMQEKIAVKNKTTEYREALNGVWENTLLSQVYFSSDNVQIIQNGLRAGVYQMSGNKYVIAPQNIDTLKIIMRSIYLQYAEHREDDITTYGLGDMHEVHSKLEKVSTDPSKILPAAIIELYNHNKSNLEFWHHNGIVDTQPKIATSPVPIDPKSKTYNLFS